MTSNINIAGLTEVTDFSYRYKMPAIQAKIEGRGNGIKTVLVNVVELAQALNRDPAEITKFFGCELGSQTTYATDTDRAVVNGAIATPDLQNHLKRYIEFFVLCKNCKLPETQYKIKSETLSQKCLACGSKDLCDMSHKLTSFILSQHKKKKEEDKKGEKEKEKKEKKEKKAAKAAAAAAGGGAEAEDSGKAAASPEETSEKKEKKEKKEKSGEKKKKKKSKEEDDGDDELVVESLDLDEEASAIGKLTVYLRGEGSVVMIPKIPFAFRLFFL